MEKHIFRFGDNSSAIIIPKKWIEKNGLKPSSIVFISESDSGSLVISAAEVVKTEAERGITPKTSSLGLERWIGLHYMYGTGKLHIHSDAGITGVQVEAVEEKIRADCPGFEITSQSNKDLVVENLTNIKEIDLEKIILRLRSLVNQEFMEATEGDQKTIPKIERLVNRFYMLGMRYVNITQANNALLYSTHLELVESISDMLNLLAANIDMKSISAFAELSNQFDESFKAFNGDEKAIERILESRERIIKSIRRAKIDQMHKYMIENIADSIANIAELGFKRQNNKEMLINGA